MRTSALVLCWVAVAGCADSTMPNSSSPGAATAASGGSGGSTGAAMPGSGVSEPASGGQIGSDGPAPEPEDGGPSRAADADLNPQPAEFALQSPALEDGGTFPEKHSCNGDDTSPALAWGRGPEGTQSYALVFTDLDAMIPGDAGPFVHWAMFNIPKELTELAEDIGDGAMPQTVPGATQVRAWSALGGAIGGSQYLGPCPGEPHHYEFALYALSVATLEGMDQNRQPTEVKALLETGDLVLAKTTLTGLYTPPP